MVGLTSDFLEKMLGIPADFAAMIIGTGIVIAIIILRSEEKIEKLNKKKKNKKF
tara:strand:- start:1326 stop:1487 length:162 start_codon:yes stop_codon:yes gene_type:complete